MPLPIPRCDGVTLNYLLGVDASDLEISTKRRAGSCDAAVSAAHPHKDQGQSGWLLLYSIAIIPLSHQHLLKLVPISFLA